MYHLPPQSGAGRTWPYAERQMLSRHSHRLNPQLWGNQENGACNTTPPWQRTTSSANLRCPACNQMAPRRSRKPCPTQSSCRKDQDGAGSTTELWWRTSATADEQRPPYNCGSHRGPRVGACQVRLPGHLDILCAGTCSTNATARRTNAAAHVESVPNNYSYEGSPHAPMVAQGTPEQSASSTTPSFPGTARSTASCGWSNQTCLLWT